MYEFINFSGINILEVKKITWLIAFNDVCLEDLNQPTTQI